MHRKTIRIGTRGSPLALIQAAQVEAALKTAFPTIETETITIRTSGDWKPDHGESRLCEAEGGKGLFAHELEKALLDNVIDCAVHSLKDMPSFLPVGLVIDHVLKREDPRDAFISYQAKHFMDLPKAAVVGTSSLRRQAFLLSKRPDLTVVPFRGNVQTRLHKLKDGQVDATFLAAAGLKRLNIEGDHIHMIEPEEMLPACAQGVIGIERRSSDERVRELLEAIHHIPTGLCAVAERAALQVLDGSCHTPIGAFARWVGPDMRFDLTVASADGRRIYTNTLATPVTSVTEATQFGATLAHALKKTVPNDIFE
jgi:hydroxymethylbilane synthase